MPTMPTSPKTPIAPTPKPVRTPTPAPAPTPTPPQAADNLTPAQIRQAYGENFHFTIDGQQTTADGTGQTIAIVIGGLDPSIASDLSTFDQANGIAAPPSFKSVYFQGAENSETADGSQETSLDVEWSHAVAPGANILLVQAASQNNTDLMDAVNYARNQPGVSVVSMSWGSPESSSDTQYDSTFTTPAGHTGVTFVASAGDYGDFNSSQKTQVGVLWPAACPNVVSVGGTSLYPTVTAATPVNPPGAGGGGGISQVYAEPSYQQGVQNTGSRTVPDVAYDADPNTGVEIYDSQSGGWIDEGGTSAGAPQWSALIAIANQGRALANEMPLDGPSQTLPALYQFSSDFNDVTTGSNGYAAGPGYDLATGLGTPMVVSLEGDLAFKVTTEYNPNGTDAMTADAARAYVEQLIPARDDDPVGDGRFLGARPARDRAVVASDTSDTSTQPTILIALPTNGPASPSSAIGHRHHRVDLALGSLMDEDPDGLRA